MGKMSELLMLLDEMIDAGNRMVESASALKEHFSSASVVAGPEKDAPKPGLVPENRPLSKSDVRALLVEKSNLADGKYKTQVKALVRKYSGGGTFSDIKQEEYSGLVAELEAVGNA